MKLEELLVSHRIGIDIGGTLAKVAYVESLLPSSFPTSTNNDCSPIKFTHDGEKFKVSFRWFPTTAPEKLVAFILDNDLLPPSRKLRVSGGGAYRLFQYLTTELQCEVVKVEEMAAVCGGAEYVLNLENEAFYYDLSRRARHERALEAKDIYPFLLVNIGSGVSILKATAPKEFKRVSGTCIGGGTVLGLSKLCFGAASFDEVVALSEKGSDKLDLTVADLIGDTAGSRRLPADTLGSSFGRLYVENKPDTTIEKAKPEDIARSAIKMVSYNLGYLASLLATVHETDRIIFGGKYIHRHGFTMQTITQAVVFYAMYGQDHEVHEAFQSSSEVDVAETHTPKFDKFVAQLQRSKRSSKMIKQEALFLRHDGYLGALGCLLAEDAPH